MKPSKVRKILRAARVFLADPAHWCQHKMAVDENGAFTVPQKAAKCCALGAIRRYTPYTVREVLLAETELQFTLGLRNMRLAVATFNDTHTHGEVLQMFDDTIARLEKRT